MCCAFATATVPRAHAGASKLNRHRDGRTWPQKSAKRIDRYATATDCSLGCAPGMLGDLSGSARRVLTRTNTLCEASLGPFIVHWRAKTMRAPLFSGRRSLLPFFRIPMSMLCAILVPMCQRLGVWTLATRAHERRISMTCLCTPNAFALLWPPLNRKRRIWREKTGSWC